MITISVRLYPEDEIKINEIKNIFNEDLIKIFGYDEPDLTSTSEVVRASIRTLHEKLTSR